MDLTGWVLARVAPRPLLVAVPGGREVRLAVERTIRQRGWDQSGAPAEADLLVVCGSPAPGLAGEVERVWSQLPFPRARADIAVVEEAIDELDRARARLADPEHRGSEATRRARPGRDDGGSTGPGTVQGGHDMQETRQDTGHDMHGDGHGMHGGEVAGLPMADRAPDRDGLTLDVLHGQLGPILADWPTGLVVRVMLQGDVVQSAQVEVLGGNGTSWDGSPSAAALDSMARLLTVCGASTPARTARRLRDGVLAGAVDIAELRRFTRRLRRSRTLHWATDGIGVLDGSYGELAGDATDRWCRWLDAVDAVDSTLPAGDPARRARAAVEALPGLLEGHELAAARVLVASLDPDLEALAVPREAAR